MTARTCGQCKELIEDKEFLENGDLVLHNICLAAWELDHCEKCRQCYKPVTGEFVELTPAGTTEKILLHPSCVDTYKESTRPNCEKCGNQILDDKFMEADGKKLHNACLASWEKDNYDECQFCKELIKGRFVELTEPVGDTKVLLHDRCVDAYKSVTRPNCSKCGNQILDDKYMKLENQFMHSGCHN